MIPAPAVIGSIGHDDPVAPVLLALVVILTAAKLAGDLAVRLGQPAVLTGSTRQSRSVMTGKISYAGSTV